LKEQGAYVIKTKPGMGTPVGCPDIVALFRDRWMVVECKASEAAPFRPGQWPTLVHLGEGNKYVYVVYPENWADQKLEMLTHFF